MEFMYTVDGLAAHLSVDPETVRRWCRSGKVQAYRIGTSYRIPESAVTAMLCRKRTEVTKKEWRSRNADI